MIASDFYDPNQNSAININHGNSQIHSYHQHHSNDRYTTGNTNMNCGNNNNNNNGNMNGLSSAVLHPALLNIMNDAQGMKYRGN